MRNGPRKKKYIEKGHQTNRQTLRLLDRLESVKTLRRILKRDVCGHLLSRGNFIKTVMVNLALQSFLIQADFLLAVT